MKIKKQFGTLFTLSVVIIPILLWLIFNQVPLNLSVTTQKLDALAKAAALGGLALLAFNIILSARLSIFERLFLGLDRAYRAHRIIGTSAVILLMLHGLLITAKYSSISLLSGYEYLKPSLDVALMLGKITLMIMIMMVSISIYLKIKYQWFITLQRLLGAMIFTGGYHALFVSGSDLRSNIPLLLYFSVLGGLAAGLYVYRSLFHKSVKRRLEYTVLSIWSGEGISVIWLKPAGRVMSFYAGQFAFFKFKSDAVDSESHPFSISSSSDNSNLRISAKASGDYTNELQNIRVGDTVQVEGPYGHFSFTKIRSKNQVWVAGGIGITPFLSMAYSMPSDYKITLYYCVRSKSQAIFLQELKEISVHKPGLRVVTIVDDEKQRITASELIKNSADDYLLCAPPSMMHDLENQLVKSGISKNNIYYEDFALK